MKTKFFVMAAMAALFSMGFTACSNNDDEMAGKEIAQARGIGFKVASDNSLVTRGLATSSSGIIFTDFQTWGYDAVAGGLYMGTDANTGKTVSLVAGDWTYTNPQFWPENSLAFVAIAPATSAEITGNTVAQAGDKVVTITSAITLDTDVEDQDDIMFAASRGADDDTDPLNVVLGTYGPVARGDHGGDVPMNFQHALSQIVFQGKLPADGTVTEVEIAEITLGNIPAQGSLSFTSAGAFYGGSTTITPTASTQANFSLDANDLEGSHFEIGGTLNNATGNSAFPLTTSNGTKPTSKPGNAWFMLPQALTAWVPGVGETKAGALLADPATNAGAYLKVRATLKKDGVTILENTNPVYIPIGQTWERGKKYIYTIMFNGTNALYPITFSVTAQDWVNADPQPGDLSF